MQQAQKYYSISEAARILGISAKTLRRWDKSGKVKINRTPNGDRIFTLEEIEKLREKVSPFSVRESINLTPQTIPQVLDVKSSIKTPSKFFVAGLTILLIALIYSNFILAFNLKQSNRVLGVESFIAPVAAEVSPILAPIGRLFSQVGSFFQTRASLFLIALLDNTPEGVVSLSSFTLSDLKVNNLSLGSTSGTTTINNNLNVVGDTTLGNLYVSGSLDVSYPTILTTLSVVNNATFASTLQVSGPVSFESTVNGNTFTNNSLVFSGVSPSISASTSNSTISLNAGTTGAINIGNSSTGDIHLGGGSASSGCSVTNDNGSFNCSSNITSGGDLIANGGDILTNQTTFNLLTQTVTTLNIGSSQSTINLQGTASFTKAPTLAHTGTWAINSSTWNQSNATVYINPATATADSNLLGIAVNGGVKFAVDAEGDIYGNNLVVAGNTTTATTTVSGDLTVEGNTTLGDATTDTFTINPATITLAGGNKTLDITGAATRTLTLLNSTTSQVADLDLSDGIYKIGGVTGKTVSACGASQYLGGLAVTGGIVTTLGSCASVSSSWSSLTDPTANLTLAMGAYTTTLNLTGTGDFDIQDNGTSAFFVKDDGTVGVNNNSPSSQFQVNTGATTTIGAIIKAQASQTADLLQIRSSLDAVLAKIDADGDLTARTLESTVTTGTAPLTVASTTVVPNLNASLLEGNSSTTLMSQPQPNLVLNSDFGRRNKWMTFMPETFTSGAGEPAGWTLETGTSLGTVSGNILTAGNTGEWSARAGLSTWRDARFSAQVKITSSGAAVHSVNKWVNSSNYVFADLEPGNNLFRFGKHIGGSTTIIQDFSHTPTLNKWYWLELEAQGTKYIAKFYSCASATDPCAKSTATLVTTSSGEVAESAAGGAVDDGYIAIRSNSSVASQWGGLSTGDGGVYVEGWGPESWDITLDGTKGGQAVGFDETADAGPLGKQWAVQTYIPAASRQINIAQSGPDGAGVPSVGYAGSTYIKTSGKGGSGDLLRHTFSTRTSGLTSLDTIVLNDAGETSWTRKTGTITSSSSSTRRTRLLIEVNPSSTATGTSYIMLPQMEQGSTVTPWRNAPGDDGPIVWDVAANNTPAPDPHWSTTSTSFTEPTRRFPYSLNAFLPWDAAVRIDISMLPNNDTVDTRLIFDATVDGTSVTPDYFIAAGYERVANTEFSVTGSAIKFQSAGKHRVALRVKTSAGTLTLRGEDRMIVTASKGKGASNESANDLAEEFSVTDLSIEAGDVVRTSGIYGSLGSASVEKVDKGYDSSIFGIIATAPAITFGNYDSVTGGIIDTSPYRYTFETDRRPVALSGRVPVKVTSENGEIRRGDFLTSSAKMPGYAMRATKAGRVIGVAMENFSSEFKVQSSELETGRIMTFVNLSFYDPDVYLTDSGQFVINKVAEQPIAQLTSDGVVSSTYNVSSGEPILNTKYLIQNTAGETIDRIGGYNNLFVANLKVGSLDVGDINNELIKNLELRIKNLEIGTSSAVLSSSISGLLDEQVASSSGIFSSLNVLGRTVLSDLGITGIITNGLLSIDGLNSSITSLTDIKLKTQSGQITIDKDGNLTSLNTISARKVSAEEFATTKAAGSSILPANSAVVDIIVESVVSASRILITPTTITDRVLVVTQKQNGKFTVGVKQVDIQDIKFDWFIIQ